MRSAISRCHSSSWRERRARRLAIGPAIALATIMPSNVEIRARAMAGPMVAGSFIRANILIRPTIVPTMPMAGAASARGVPEADGALVPVAAIGEILRRPEGEAVGIWRIGQRGQCFDEERLAGAQPVDARDVMEMGGFLGAQQHGAGAVAVFAGTRREQGLQRADGGREGGKALLRDGDERGAADHQQHGRGGTGDDPGISLIGPIIPRSGPVRRARPAKGCRRPQKIAGLAAPLPERRGIPCVAGFRIHRKPELARPLLLTPCGHGVRLWRCHSSVRTAPPGGL